MFWLARARPYQRTKRREPPGARDGPMGRRAADGWAGRGGGTLVGEREKRDGAEYAIFARGFSKRRHDVRWSPARGGGGRGPDAGGAVSVARESAGHRARQLRYTYPEKSSKRRSMVGRGGVDGAAIASHVVGAGGIGCSAGTHGCLNGLRPERETRRWATVVSGRR